MPKLNGTVGCGPNTGVKHMHWSGLCGWLVTAGASFVRQRNGLFYYIETHAGPGRYELEGEEFIGSPLRGLPIVHAKVGAGRYRASLIDLSEANLRELQKHVLELSLSPETPIDMGAVRFVPSDYASAIDATIAGAKPRNWCDRGLMLVDANGDPDWARLATVSHTPAMYSIDFAIYFDAGVTKRVRRAVPGAMRYQPNSPKWPAKDLRPVHERLADFRKAVWLVREPLGDRGQQWTYLIGTNWTGIKEWAKAGFYRIDRPRGLDILLRISLTEAEREPQIEDQGALQLALEHDDWKEQQHARAGER
jgi:three-Cys-motif partner protein